MTSAWISVEATSMTINRIPRRCRLAGWTATSTPCCAASAASVPRRASVSMPDTCRSMAGTGERAIRSMRVEGGKGVPRHPLDAVDVGAAVGDPARHGRHLRGLERGADHGHVRAPTAPGPVVARAAVDLDAHLEVPGRGLHGVAEPLPVAGDGDQYAEDEPAAQHDLLDVDHLDTGPGERGEDRRRDAGPVLAGERDEQRLRPRAPMVVHRP